VLAYSVVQAKNLSQRDVDSAVPMTFTGQITVGGPNVTFTGTAESIWAQVLEKNPKYDPWEFPEYRQRMASKGITRETQNERFHRGPTPKRDTLLSKRDAVNLLHS
jgi:hypothetical protein